MKKLLVLLMVLGVVSTANAALLLCVDYVIDPPDTAVTLIPSEHATISVYSDAQTQANTEVWLTVIGPGELDITNGTVYGEPSYWERLVDVDFNLFFIDLYLEMEPPPIPEGMVVDLLDFHCTGPEDVILLLGSTPGGSQFDTQVIHQVPEPMTIVLLGLGGLFLRRRR